MLRDYQRELYDSALRSLAQHKRTLVVAPCGSGKSYIFAEMVSQCRGKVLILTHRRELLRQHQELIDDARIEMVFTEKNHLDEHDRPDLLIVDEAHLSAANTWRKVIEYYDTYTVGFTATPERLDGKPLGDIYADMVSGRDIRWLIDNQYLAPFEYYAPFTVDASDIRHNDDYVVDELEKLMMDRKIYSEAVRSYQRLADGKKALCYCVSIKHAEAVAESFREAGYKAVAVSSKTPTAERERIIRHEDWDVLCNCNVVSEGISLPDVECCILLRPTMSTALHIQQSQRCMRYKPGKTAIVLDLVGNYTRHGLPDEAIEWSLEHSHEKHKQHNADGSYSIRVCPECFQTFRTAPVCPYCGAEYPVQGRELEVIKDVELKRIQAEEAKAAEQARKQARREQGMARTFPELVRIGQERGYKNPQYWARMVLQSRR